MLQRTEWLDEVAVFPVMLQPRILRQRLMFGENHLPPFQDQTICQRKAQALKGLLPGS